MYRISMAEITKSDAAPAGPIRYSFGAENYTISERKPLVTDDLALIDAANIHPWLQVNEQPAAAASVTEEVTE